jgi:hypothetical protein
LSRGAVIRVRALSQATAVYLCAAVVQVRLNLAPADILTAILATRMYPQMTQWRVPCRLAP